MYWLLSSTAESFIQEKWPAVPEWCLINIWPNPNCPFWYFEPFISSLCWRPFLCLSCRQCYFLLRPFSWPGQYGSRTNIWNNQGLTMYWRVVLKSTGRLNLKPRLTYPIWFDRNSTSQNLNITCHFKKSPL